MGRGGGGVRGSRRQVSHSGDFILFVEVFCHFGCRSGLCHLFVHKTVFRATGRPSSSTFEGRYAPRSTDSRTIDENTVPTTANRRSTRAEATRRAPTFKLLAWREDLRRPWSPASTQRGDLPAKQPSWSLSSPLLANSTL